MAEAFGIVGAAIGVAAEGLKLSQTLYEFVENVRLADTDIKDVADDVSSTAVVLQQFEASLKLDEESMICTGEFYKVTSENIEGCSAAFASIDKALQKSIRVVRDAPAANGNLDQVFELRRRDKFRWPFNKQRIENHRRNLDRLKANLNLKMQVMAHAREIHERQKASRASENEEKIKALRVEALALEVQEAERKYHEIKTQMDETEVLVQKKPRKREPATGKQLRRPSSDSAPEKSQHLRAEGQSGGFEGSSADGPSSELQNSADKQSGEIRAQDVSSLPFSKIEVLLSRIAGAQEAIVLAGAKQGPPVSFTDPTKSFDSRPLEQIRGASRARVTRGARREDLQQIAREPKNGDRSRILDHRPLDRIARVQERLAGMTQSSGSSHVDPFSRNDESTESEDDYVFHTPTEGNKDLEINEEPNDPVQRGEDALQTVTKEQSVGEREKSDLGVAREIDRSSLEAESNDGGNTEWNERLIPTPDNNDIDRPSPIAERHVKSKGKDKQYTLEQMPRRPHLLTGFIQNSTSIEMTADAGVERVQRLTPSTGALVLYNNRSTWIRGLTNDPGASFEKREFSLHLLDSLQASSSSAISKSPTLFTAAAPELQPPVPILKDTIESLTNHKPSAEPSLNEVEERKSPVIVKKFKHKEREKHRPHKETTQQGRLLRNNESEGDNTNNQNLPNYVSSSHDQADSEVKPSISNEQSSSLPGKAKGNYEDAEDADLSRNNAKLNATDDQTLTSPTQLDTASDAPIIQANHLQAPIHRGSGDEAGNSNAVEANNQDTEQDPGDSQSGSVEPIIISYSRLARLRRLLLPRFIRRYQISRMINDDAEDDHASTISGTSDRTGKRKTHGLRFSQRVAMMINPKRFKNRSFRLKRNMKTWFYRSWRLSSSSISGRSYADSSSYSYYTYTENSDEEGNNQLAIVRPTAGETSPKSEFRERIFSRRRSKIRTYLPPAFQNLPSQKNNGRDSQRQAKHQKPHKPSQIADERATEYLVPNPTSTGVVDLDEPPDFVATGFTGSYEKPLLEAWLLRPSDPLPGQARSWRQARRIFIPLGEEELEAKVEQFNQKIKKRHSKPLWTTFRSLSSDQQQHIERLLAMKGTRDNDQRWDTDQRFQWTVVALKVGHGASLKLRDSLYIELILKKPFHFNAWRAPVNPPMAFPSYPAPVPNRIIFAEHSQPLPQMQSQPSVAPPNFERTTFADRPQPPQRGRSRRSIIPPPAPPRRNSSSASLSTSIRSFTGSEGIRVVGFSSSDEERKAINQSNRFNSRKAERRSKVVDGIRKEAIRKAEQELKHKKDQKNRKRSVFEDRGKEKEEKDSERATGLEKASRKIMRLERMLEDHERLLEQLRMEESKKSSFGPFRRTMDDARLDQSRQSYGRLFDYPKEPTTRRDAPSFQPLSYPSPYRGRDANALDLHGASPYPLRAQGSREFGARSRYPQVASLSPYATTELPANETGFSRPRARRNVDVGSRDRPENPAVRFREHNPSATQDFSKFGVPLVPEVPSSPEDSTQSLGPLFGPAGSQFRPPSPLAPKTSMPPLNPTLNNLISQWTTLKVDIPKEKQQPPPAGAAGSPSNDGKKGNERPPRPLPPPQTKPQGLSTYNEGPPYRFVPARPPISPLPVAGYERTSTSHYDPQTHSAYGSLEKSIPSRRPRRPSHDKISPHPSYIPTLSSNPNPYPSAGDKTRPTDYSNPNPNSNPQPQSQPQPTPPPPPSRLDARLNPKSPYEIPYEPRNRLERRDSKVARKKEGKLKKRREKGKGTNDEGRGWLSDDVDDVIVRRDGSEDSSEDSSEKSIEDSNDEDEDEDENEGEKKQDQEHGQDLDQDPDDWLLYPDDVGPTGPHRYT